jgi:hypothetical protein
MAQGWRIDWTAVNLEVQQLLGRIGLDIDATRFFFALVLLVATALGAFWGVSIGAVSIAH